MGVILSFSGSAYVNLARDGFLYKFVCSNGKQSVKRSWVSYCLTYSSLITRLATIKRQHSETQVPQHQSGSKLAQSHRQSVIHIFRTQPHIEPAATLSTFLSSSLKLELTQQNLYAASFSLDNLYVTTHQLKTHYFTSTKQPIDVKLINTSNTNTLKIKGG